MKAARIVVAVAAALALAATLALLALAAPSASTQHAGVAVYCPDRSSRKSDLESANRALKAATANAKARHTALARAKKRHKHVAAAKKAYKASLARQRDAKDAQRGAAAAFAACD